MTLYQAPIPYIIDDILARNWVSRECILRYLRRKYRNSISRYITRATHDNFLYVHQRSPHLHVLLHLCF